MDTVRYEVDYHGKLSFAWAAFVMSLIGIPFSVGKAKPVRVGKARITLSVDLFNVFNGNTIQARQRTQNSTIANNIQALVAPRVARFGARLSW